MYDKNIQEVTVPLAEYTPAGKEVTAPIPEYPGTPGPERPAEVRSRKRRLLRLLLAAVLVSGMLLIPRLHSAPLPPGPAAAAPVPAQASAEPHTDAPTASPEPTATPAPAEEPTVPAPEIQPLFFSFSHEHHASIRLGNTERLRGVTVTVRETELDKTVFEHVLQSDEIAGGIYELPVLSTGDVYMESMDAYDRINAWPSFEMKIVYRYENETGDGEETEALILEPVHETGYGATYWAPGYTWDDQLPPDSFVIAPWDEAENIRYVFDSPDSVKDAETVYVDVECLGRHVSPEEYETILKKEDYFLMDPQGQETPLTSYTSELILRRPDWMPASGTLHITIVQMLVSTGELYSKTMDLDFP